MSARLREIWSDVLALVADLPPARRALVLGATAGSLVLVLGLAWWVQRPFYRPLFTNLGQEDAAAIVSALAAERVPYEIGDEGRSVLVPADRLYALRLTLASRGLPEGGGVGFEVFDKQQLGQTDFVQRLNYQRALQGELGRTIAELGGVESARVHLAIPERSLFVSQDRRPSASVVVKLVPGRALGAAQVDGIVHLIASSVQGLTPDAVTVVDEGGRMLTAAAGGDDAIAAGSGALQYQRGIERATEERIESLLATIVGPGKVIARVAAAVDFSRTERDEDTYDPEKTVVLESHSTRDDAGKAASGVAGAAPAAGDRGAAAGPGGARRDETQRYAVSKTTSRTVIPVGGVKSLSVAVLVDGTYREQGGARVFAPRPDDELEKLKTLVASAVGISDARGDRLELTSAEFQTPEAEAAPGMLAQTTRWLPAIAGRVLGVVLLLGVLVTVVRPLVRALAAAGARTRPRLGGTGVDREGVVGELTRENVTLAQQNPERAAQLVRQWLHEGTKGTA
jgi:flagellar M-ring protein FliF